MERIDHRELKRKSEDIIAVYNPDDADFIVKWDGHLFTIPGANRDTGFGKGVRHLPRYLAFRYMKRKTDEILGRKSLEAVEAENKNRKKKGLPPMTPHTEQYNFQNAFAVNNRHLRKQIMTSLYKGLVSEYGRDLEPEQIAPKARDLRNDDEKLFDELTGFQMPMTTVEESEAAAIDEDVLAQAFEDAEPDTASIV